MDGRRDAKAEDYMSLCTKVAPGDEGKDVWLEALKKATNDDQELIDFIQLVAGLGLIGEVRRQMATFIWGPSGSAKSTIWNAMTAVLGTYAINLNADILLSNKISDNNIQSERASLRKKRWALCSETDEGMLSESSLKRLVSTDRIKGRHLFKDGIEFEPSHSVYCYLNKLPGFDVYNEAVRNRILVIPFTAVIPNEERIFNYGKVLAETAGPAILAFLIEGARKVIELNFNIEEKMPAKVAEFMREYEGKQDWLSEFLEEVCVFGDDQCVNPRRLYDVHVAWCRAKNIKAVSTQVFSELMKSRYPHETRRETLEDGKRPQQTVYKGLSLNPAVPLVLRCMKEN
ncbi:MAG: hypothetical protein HUJ75_07205 [Parasporobacterium sp.]|nr:hypothetical protein [Parasporobacterium sp.]